MPVAEDARVYVPGKVPDFGNFADIESWLGARAVVRSRTRRDREIAVMSGRGDSKFMWDPDNEEEVAEAKALYDRMAKKRFTAFSVKGKDGEKGEKMTSFDPEAGRVIFVPQIAGGV